MVATTDAHQNQPRTQNRIQRPTRKPIDQQQQQQADFKQNSRHGNGYYARRNRNNNASSENRNQNTETNHENNTKTKPILEKSLSLPNSKALVALELIKNSKEEPFFIMRAEYTDNVHRSSRIALPFQNLPEIYDGLRIGSNHLQEKTLKGVLEELNAENNAIYANMKSLNISRSKYYIDFQANAERTDISLKFAERKILPKQTQPRSYELFFDKSDIDKIHDALVNFDNEAKSHASDILANQTGSPRFYRQGRFMFEWITKKNNNIDCMLKISSGSNRIIFPVNILKSARNIMTKISEVYQKCQTDLDAYLEQMNTDIEEQNVNRAENNLPLRPLLTEHPILRSTPVEKNNATPNDSVPPKHKDTVLRSLYTRKLISRPNQRSYHFDIVQSWPSDLNNPEAVKGPVSVRLVEMQHSKLNQRDQDGNQKNVMQRHAVFVPISEFDGFFKLFQEVHDNNPLPKETAFYHPNGRFFIKYIVRSEGLNLKLKLQKAVGTVENTDAMTSESGENDRQTAQTKYGETESIELPMNVVMKMINFLKLSSANSSSDSK